jgi:streptogramin lyase
MVASMPLRTRAALPLALLALAFPATASASITEFTGLTKGTPSGGITAGPDGAVWFTIGGDPGGIGHIHADGSITEHLADEISGFTHKSDPADIVTGPDGALWFTERGDGGAIARFDPVTETITEYCDNMTRNADPTGIAVGPDGNLWFTEAAHGAIGRITPEGVITEFTSGLSGSSEPTDIAAGADGNLWFTMAGDPATIGRIDPGTGEITQFNGGLAPDAAPASIIAASNGKLYFTQPGVGRIGKVKTDGKVEDVAGLAAGSRPSGIAEGGDGALWFTTANAPGPIGRLWPDSGAFQQLTGGLTAVREPGGITRGPDGNLWYTLRDLPGIGRVTVPPKVGVGTPVIHDGQVKLKGDVAANSQETTYFFEYGRDGALDTQTAVASAGDEAGEVAVTALVDLQRDAAYTVRITAVNASGTAVSTTKPFYLTADGQIVKDKPTGGDTSTIVIDQPTTTTPPALEPPAVAVLPPAAPVLGQSVNVAPVTGTVRVKPPGAEDYSPLAAGASIPVGALVDAREGRVELRTALRQGKTQTGTFWGSIFKVRQRRDGRGMTDLVLRGGSFASCPGSQARRSAVAQTAAKRGKVVRRLWGKDRHARFRTHGRDSVATVRGTVWSTVDRCDGTLTRVKEGKVLVRDLRAKRSVLLRAGRSYLARHHR